MKNVWNFFKGKGFYIVLGVGLVAFITLVSVYSYKRNVNSLDKNKGVDLNQSVDVAGDGDADKADAAVNNQTENDSKKNGQETASNEADSDAENHKNEAAATEEDSVEKADADNKTGTEGSSAAAANRAEAQESDTEEETDSEVVGVVSEGASADKTGEIEAGLEYDGERALIWPIVGDVIIPYSMETTVFYPTLNTYKCNPGMMIAGEEGAKVLSAYEGVVTDITADADKGNLVTVSLGNGYKITYGQLTDITVEKGATVSTGQEIGSIAPPTSHYTKEGSHLYLEMTKDGASVNPSLYFQD